MSEEPSPYEGLPTTQWRQKTLELIEAHPLEPAEILEVAQSVWDDIFESGIGGKPFRIGTDLFPKPQIMGFFLHELIPLEFNRRYPDQWRGEVTARDKDMVFVPDPHFSIEIKTSSHKSKIFGNRSYAQKAKGNKKSKSGYYIAINFGKFEKGKAAPPRLLRVRFGWLDYTDWQGQAAATGQQANLPSEVEDAKLLELFPEWKL